MVLPPPPPPSHTKQLLMSRGGHLVYFCVYTSNVRFREIDDTCWARLVYVMQRYVLGSDDVHIAIALDEERYDEDGHPLLTPYDISSTHPVSRSHKSLDKYPTKCSVNVTHKQYVRLKEFLDYHVERRTEFNSLAYYWNFCPCTRSCCTCRGRGFFCAEFIMEALLHAGIIHQEGTVDTKGEPPSCVWCLPCLLHTFCTFCCPCYEDTLMRRPLERTIPVPKPHMISVTTLLDVIRCQCPTFVWMSSRTNAHDYARRKEVDPSRLRKRAKIEETDVVVVASATRKKKSSDKKKKKKRRRQRRHRHRHKKSGKKKY